MKKNNLILLAGLFSILISLNSCVVAGGIFKAGLWMGIIIVVLVVAIILWIVGKARK